MKHTTQVCRTRHMSRLLHAHFRNWEGRHEASSWTRHKRTSVSRVIQNPCHHSHHLIIITNSTFQVCTPKHLFENQPSQPASRNLWPLFCRSGWRLWWIDARHMGNPSRLRENAWRRSQKDHPPLDLLALWCVPYKVFCVQGLSWPQNHHERHVTYHYAHLVE